MKGKYFACESGFFQSVTIHKLWQNANFENGNTTVESDIMRMLLNILSVYLLSKVYDMSGYYKMHKKCHIFLLICLFQTHFATLQPLIDEDGSIGIIT